MSGNKDNGKLDIQLHKLVLKIETVQAWEPHVQHDAAGGVRPLKCKNSSAVPKV